VTVLCDWEIAALCQTVKMVDPFRKDLINPASIDLLLGNEIMCECENTARLQRLDISEFTREQPYLLGPGAFVLAQTQEVFNLPDDISAQFALKSSRAREGFTHALAGWCDPGWSGSVLTLELMNARRWWPLGLYPGLKIGQMIFHRMSSTPEKSYAMTGHYNNHLQVMGSVA